MKTSKPRGIMKSAIYAAIIAAAIATAGVLAAAGTPLSPLHATAQAATLDDARAMLSAGQLTAARAALDSIVKAQPKSAEAELLLGECLEQQGLDAMAHAAYSSARKKGSHEAMLALARLTAREYSLDEADKHLAEYKAFLTKNKRKNLPDLSGDVAEQITRTRSMLDRVENIVIIDSIAVDRDDFFKAYRLSSESGTINSVDVLPRRFSHATPTAVYITEDGREMIWADVDDDGGFNLVASNLLADGSWEQPAPLGDSFAQGGDANYPFLMPDGVTLYFASNGEGSLGGYDIFIARSDGSEFLQPQNVGMPYNSPYDDYMLAIDEMTGAGWWATDRNRLGDKITIYTFIPSEMRVNISLDDPGLTDRAKVTSYRDTWVEGEDYGPLLERIRAIMPAKAKAEGAPLFALPDGRIVTSTADLKSKQARELLGRYIEIKRLIASDGEQLDRLRARLAAGDEAVKPDILSLERKQMTDAAALKRISNDIVRAEAR